jgi:hypothetical protein
MLKQGRPFIMCGLIAEKNEATVRLPVLQTVPHFVPTLSRKPSQMVAKAVEPESSVLAWKINTIANHRTRKREIIDDLLSGRRVATG